jgi:hypothetical protein
MTIQALQDRIKTYKARRALLDGAIQEAEYWLRILHVQHHGVDCSCDTPDAPVNQLNQFVSGPVVSGTGDSSDLHLGVGTLSTALGWEWKNDTVYVPGRAVYQRPTRLFKEKLAEVKAKREAEKTFGASAPSAKDTYTAALNAAEDILRAVKAQHPELSELFGNYEISEAERVKSRQQLYALVERLLGEAAPEKADK